MVLKSILSQKRQAILKRWLKLILETYPADTSGFLKQEKDRFVNPIRHTISQEIEALYDELLQGMNVDRLASCLTNIIKIRSVQDFSPSQAVVFVFLLKKAIREELAAEIKESRPIEELLEFESRIDKLALLALDVYMQCREKIHEIRLSKIKLEREMALKLLQRTELLDEKPESKEDSEDTENLLL